jgi:hypothetical protein
MMMVKWAYNIRMFLNFGLSIRTTWTEIMGEPKPRPVKDSVPLILNSMQETVQIQKRSGFQDVARGRKQKSCFLK